MNIDTIEKLARVAKLDELIAKNDAAVADLRKERADIEADLQSAGNEADANDIAGRLGLPKRRKPRDAKPGGEAVGSGETKVARKRGSKGKE